MRALGAAVSAYPCFFPLKQNGSMSIPWASAAVSFRKDWTRLERPSHCAPFCTWTPPACGRHDESVASHSEFTPLAPTDAGVPTQTHVQMVRGAPGPGASTRHSAQRAGDGARDPQPDATTGHAPPSAKKSQARLGRLLWWSSPSPPCRSSRCPKSRPSESE